MSSYFDLSKLTDELTEQAGQQFTATAAALGFPIPLKRTFSDDDLKPHAGHMFSAEVHVVAEIHLRLLTHAIMTRCPLENSEFVALRFG